MIIIRCCHNCDERHKGCHSDCEKYASEKSEALAKKEKYCDSIEGYNSTKRTRIAHMMGRKTKRFK